MDYSEIKENIYNNILKESILEKEEINLLEIYEKYIEGNINHYNNISIEEQVMSILLEEGALDTLRQASRGIGMLCLIIQGLSLSPQASATPLGQGDHPSIIGIATSLGGGANTQDDAEDDDAEGVKLVNIETGEEIDDWAAEQNPDEMPEVDLTSGDEVIDSTPDDQLKWVNLQTGEVIDDSFFNIPKAEKDKTLSGIRSAMLKLQQEAHGIDMPDISPDSKIMKKLLDRAYKLEEMFLKTKSNYFMYSMVVTMVMNASKGTSAGRSSIANSIYLKNKAEREEMFLLYTVGMKQNKIDNYIKQNNIKKSKRSQAITSLIKEATKSNSQINDQWKIFQDIESTLSKTSGERGFSGGAIWMWSPRGINKTDLGNSVPEEQVNKAKEHFCGGTQNYLMQILKESYGDLEIPDRAFNSIQKWHKNPKVRESLVFDYKAFIGVPAKITSRIMSNVVTRGMIAIVKTSSSFRATEEGGHFGWVVKVVPPKQMSEEDYKNLSASEKTEADGYVELFEGNTTDKRALQNETGFRLVKRPFSRIASAAAISPIFSKSTRKSLVDILKTTSDLRQVYTKSAIDNWLKKKLSKRKKRISQFKRRQNRRNISRTSRRQNRRG